MRYQAIVLSFFKGGLDLIEGALHSKGIHYARFDGDLGPEIRSAELRRFKEDADCKVLLMTVQSGGVGLNIVEANHVAFLDRWYNPFVHLQAEDRCHRIKQKKEVQVCYFDCSTTLDEVMYHLNAAKMANSAIILADGSKIGNDGNLKYKDLAGMLTKLLRSYREYRSSWLNADSENKEKPIPVHRLTTLEPGSCRSLSVDPNKAQLGILDKQKYGSSAEFPLRISLSDSE